MHLHHTNTMAAATISLLLWWVLLAGELGTLQLTLIGAQRAHLVHEKRGGPTCRRTKMNFKKRYSIVLLVCFLLIVTAFILYNCLVLIPSEADKRIGGSEGNAQNGPSQIYLKKSSDSEHITAVENKQASTVHGHHTIDQTTSTELEPNSFTFNDSHKCFLCHNTEKLHIYYHNFGSLNSYFGSFGNSEKRMPKYCPLPNGATCVPQHSEKNADVVFKSIQTGANSEKFCEHQLLAVLNGEAPRSSAIMDSADIRVDHHPTSHGMFSGACGIAIGMSEDRTPPNPADRKGVALLMSNCGVKWRSDYIQELMKYVHIDSYGSCFHNVQRPPSRTNFMGSYEEIASKYRMVVTFENRIIKDYISEKIVMAYRSGVIPVYWGPPQVYQWVPGNHTFIDASKYTAKELGDYLNRINTDDKLFEYHTRNYDVKKAQDMWEKHCDIEGYVCQVCKVGYRMKLEFLQKGLCT